MPDLENLLNIEDEVTQVLSDLGVTAKLEEVDDFMNQNDLKVSITNETNAATTGLVTYTCTVKDNDNTALANRVVEWYKGTTLLGLDATDSNGISTFSHRVTEADIYDVHAVVRGTHAGDDIRMFVKEKRNLLPFDIWAMENPSSSSIEKGATINLNSNYEWVKHGFSSLEANVTSQSSSSSRVGYQYVDNSIGGKTFKATVDVKTDDSTWKLQMLYYTDNWSSPSSVTITNGESSPYIQLEIPSGATKIWIRLNTSGEAGSSILSDNWRLEEV